MHPEAMTIGNRLLELGIVLAEALRESFFPGKTILLRAPPPHSRKVVGARDEEKNCEEDVIEPANDAIH